MNKNDKIRNFKRKKDGEKMRVEEIVNFAEKNNGFISTAELKNLKVDYRGTQKLIEKEILEKVKNGLYRLKDKNLSEEDIVSNLFSDGVLCMESALYFYGYIDTKPFNWCIAINKDTSKSRFKIDYPFVKPFYMEEDQLELGVTSIAFGSGNMKIYDRERTIVDCLKYESKMDRSAYTTAIRKYIEDPEKDPTKLFEYAQKRRIYKKAKDVLGIWI